MDKATNVNLASIFAEILGDTSIMGAIASSILIILLGFYLTRKGIFTDALAKGLSVVILTVALPALSFNSFMQDINSETLKQGLSILVWGFVFQGILIFVTRLYYFNYKQDARTALSVLTTLGSTTFFAIPIIGVVYGAQGVLYASIFNISYRVYLYSWGFVSFSGLKMNKENLKSIIINPIILATFLGLFVWIFQAYLPQVSVVTPKGVQEYAFLRIDKTLAWFYKPLTYLAALASPLAWLSIGATLGRVTLGEAFTNKAAWHYSITKIIIVPILSIVGLCIVNYFTDISFMTMAVSAIMMATPPATVAVAYAIKFEREAVLSSQCSLLSTIMAVIIIPVVILVLEIIKQINIFS